MSTRTTFASLRSGRHGAFAAAALLTACSLGEPAGQLAESVDRGSAPLVEEPTSAPQQPQPEPEPEEAPGSDVSRTVEELRDVPFVVLLLPPHLADGAVITSGPVWYAMAHDAPRDLNVAIHATNFVHMNVDDAEIPPPNASVRGLPARTTVNEGIRSVTWVERDVAYVVEIECWDVLEDRRCAEPDFALEVADGLVELPR